MTIQESVVQGFNLSSAQAAENPNMQSAPQPTPQQALATLAELLYEGYENPDHVRGVVQLVIDDAGTDYPLRIALHDTLELSFVADPTADATLRMPFATAQTLLDTLEYADFRDPDIIGAITLTGQLDLINHVAKALLRPSEDTLTRFQTAENKAMPAYRMTDIPRLENPSELTILQALAAGQPMIITGLPMRTPHSEWSLERLERDYGDVPLRVRSAEQKETVAEFIARVREAEHQRPEDIVEGHTKAYTEGCALPEAMRPDFLPNHFLRSDYIEPQIWLGAVPVNVPASSLHHDPLDGFLYQVMGRKKLFMFAPDQAPFLYPMKAYNNYQPCWVKPEAPDLSRYPLYAQAKGIEVVLNPGELLVQPAGWFHAVYCLDSPTFSVSYFFRH
ncbi:cupin-like domain-containing protein [Salinispirillum sp. LH 10-3-1]|uniref:Cupin-like domain-containing protein n=1 Tax=Salinispirillum sp. LH 10-3-1 TaxID=2952525 RepID=A0AB38YFU1_9GAMM